MNAGEPDARIRQPPVGRWTPRIALTIGFDVVAEREWNINNIRQQEVVQYVTPRLEDAVSSVTEFRESSAGTRLHLMQLRSEDPHTRSNKCARYRDDDSVCSKGMRCD
jgi:hypothetical protein